jgi:PPOX class probable F420-dependent enzyme
MADLSTFEALVPLDHGLCVIVARRADGRPATSVVNVGAIDHPLTGERVVAFVAQGVARKLVHLRADALVSVVIRAGWQWATVEGDAQIVGPDDPAAGVDDERLRLLLREIFVAAGGSHDDWDAYDATMRDERRAAVLVVPTRTYSNPT